MGCLWLHFFSLSDLGWNGMLFFLFSTSKVWIGQCIGTARHYWAATFSKRLLIANPMVLICHICYWSSIKWKFEILGTIFLGRKTTLSSDGNLFHILQEIGSPFMSMANNYYNFASNIRSSTKFLIIQVSQYVAWDRPIHLLLRTVLLSSHLIQFFLQI